MRLGYPISLILHGAALFGGMVLYSGKVVPSMEGRVIPVEMVTVAEFTNIKAAIKAPEPEDIVEPEEPMRLEEPIENAPEEAPPEEAAEPEPEPETPSEPVEEVVEAVPSEEPEEVLEEPEDKPKEPEKPAFNLDNLAAMVDKSRQSQPDKNQQRTLVAEANSYEFAETARKGSGDQNDLTLSELDALQSKMYQCWRMPADAKNPEELTVQVQVRLGPKGELEDARLTDRAGIYASGNSHLKTAAERALRAVAKCAPYDFLPEEKYSAWKDMKLNFRPPV